MKEKKLDAISPVDGRYRDKVDSISKYFSEKALIYYRLKVEIEYFLFLCKNRIGKLKPLSSKNNKNLRDIYNNFSIKDAIEIKKIEEKTNHDVKAVEYFIKKKFDQYELTNYKEFIHFGLTSQDINNTAIPLSVKEFINNIYLPELDKLIKYLDKISKKYKDITIISRTHGQPASPTKLGKEILVFSTRIKNQRKSLVKIPNSAKFGGAVGNFNAHKVAFPKIKWKTFGKRFVESELGLDYSFPTTQIEHYDSFASLCDNVRRINNILLDLSLDTWTYISLDYFKQKINKDEVGSSAMPHKVNPIDFENAEGNIGLANSIFDFFSNKLTKSRLQRDLSDSTVLRNIGVPFSHTIISIKSIIKGLDKLIVNKSKINADLEENWIIISEAIQTILRREGYPNPYESLKELTRKNTSITKEILHKFIDTLEVNKKIKDELKVITPSNYTGI
ncbi:MAG TPA: adenylosuccinate lyase [Flavobacteriaceae bacterium]|nr:adenylosuccinate lyase [Flavobacteriaceae bacterium]